MRPPSGSIAPTKFSSIRGSRSGAVTRLTPKASRPAAAESTATATSGWIRRRRRRPRRCRLRRRWTGRRRGRRRVERRIVREDRLLEPLQLGPGLDADLLDERVARLPVGVERLGLAPGAIQREHPLGVQPLAQRVLRDERLELADHVGVPPRREVRLDRQLVRVHAQLVEPADLGGGERLARRRRRAPRRARARAPRAAGTRPPAARTARRRPRRREAGARSRGRA